MTGAIGWKAVALVELVAMVFRKPFLVAAALLCAPVLALAQQDRVVDISPQDPAMAAAYQKARDGLAGFLELLRNPPEGAEKFAVKIGIVDGKGGGHRIVRSGDSSGRSEFFWVNDLKREGDQFTGRIANTPMRINNVSEGQKIRFSSADISDWTYARAGVIYGNATACPLIARMSEEERAPYLQKLPSCR
jgi:uncharacterized protein YegJ (DUF2314 family)